MKQELKLFVWEGEGVLPDWTSGMICVLAKDLKQALKLIQKKDSSCEGFSINKYKVIKNPEAFICYGGG